MKLARLEGGKRPPDFQPGLLSEEFRHCFDEKREDTKLHVGFDAFGKPVVHRLHNDPGALKGPEGTLDHEESLITRDCIFYGDNIIVGL